MLQISVLQKNKYRMNYNNIRAQYILSFPRQSTLKLQQPLGRNGVYITSTCISHAIATLRFNDKALYDMQCGWRSFNQPRQSYEI